jgi:hypothetical protein
MQAFMAADPFRHGGATAGPGPAPPLAATAVKTEALPEYHGLSPSGSLPLDPSPVADPGMEEPAPDVGAPGACFLCGGLSSGTNNTVSAGDVDVLREMWFGEGAKEAYTKWCVARRGAVVGCEDAVWCPACGWVWWVWGAVGCLCLCPWCTPF